MMQPTMENDAVPESQEKPIAAAVEGLESIPFFTIDSESTRDIDDALYVEREGDGFVLRIAIADPTRLVAMGSEEDGLAMRLGHSTYADHRTIRSMLPRAISEGAGSLIAGAVRKAMVITARLSSDLSVAGFDVAMGKVTVRERLSYSDIPLIVRMADHPLHDAVRLATDLARRLLHLRRSRGALALFDLVRLMLTDEEGRIMLLESADEAVGQILVQEAMILGNTLCARFAMEHDIPMLYRNHETKVSTPEAGELAKIIEGWMVSGAAKDEEVRARFSEICGVAKYEPVVKGHYGLALPLYTHITSPLRRYADLVNMRQIEGFLARKRAPYSQAELVEIGEALNEAVVRRKEEKSEGFKKAVRQHAEKAIGTGALKTLADYELRQGIKIAVQAGVMPDHLVAEIVDRLEQAVVQDVTLDTLMVEIEREQLPQSIRMALVGLFNEFPGKAMHVLAHALQVGAFTKYAPSDVQVDAGFLVEAAAELPDGSVLTGRGLAVRKRDAEQAAVIVILSRWLGQPVAEQAVPAVGAAPADLDNGVNYKGKLLEWCQKHKVTSPKFTVEGKGPSNAMVFAGSACVKVDGTDFIGEAKGAKSRKGAEALISKDLLEKLGRLAGVAIVEKKVSAEAPVEPSDNPISDLQIYMQRNRFPLPEYAFKEIKGVPVKFECTVIAHCVPLIRSISIGSSKQAAKAEAAKKAVKEIHSRTKSN